MRELDGDFTLLYGTGAAPQPEYNHSRSIFVFQDGRELRRTLNEKGLTAKEFGEVLQGMRPVRALRS
jgi:hypothetical protein